MITIIDYGVGNINAFVNVYKRLNIQVKIAKTVADLEYAQKLILPGVGHFDHAMSELIKSGMKEKLDELVLVKKIPVIGMSRNCIKIVFKCIEMYSTIPQNIEI